MEGNPENRKRLKLVFLAGGIALTVWLVWHLGPDRIWAVLSRGTWQYFGLVICAYIFQQFLGTYALWLLGTRNSSGWHSTSFGHLARARYVGEVLNYTMPTGAFGGEPYKYLVLKRHEDSLRLMQALAAAKFLHLAGTGPFAVMVFFSAAVLKTGGESWQTVFFLAGVLSFTVTVAVWSLVLWQGTGRTLFKAFYRIRHMVPRRLWRIRKLLYMDRSAAIQIRRTRVRAAAAYVLYIAMWWAAACEWLAIARVLGIGWKSLGLTGGGLFVCATLVVNGLIPVPAGAGTQEGGRIAAAGLLGLSPETGIAMSLIRRTREIVMVISGFIIALTEYIDRSIDYLPGIRKARKSKG